MSKGEKAVFSMARVLAVAECGTHAIFAAKVGACTQSEATLATDLLAGVFEPGMLLAADRGFFSYALWRTCTATGADLLWRIRTDKAGPKPEYIEELPNGSWPAHLHQTHSAAARRAEPILVRVIDYALQDGRDLEPVTYRLFTTMLDPDQAPAADLALAYAQRWGSRTPSTSSRPTSADPASCSARSRPTWCSRRSGDTCAATTRSDR